MLPPPFLLDGTVRLLCFLTATLGAVENGKSPVHLGIYIIKALINEFAAERITLFA